MTDWAIDERLELASRMLRCSHPHSSSPSADLIEGSVVAIKLAASLRRVTERRLSHSIF